jgi:MFS family permease
VSDLRKPQKVKFYVLIFSLFFLVSAAGLISYFAIVEFERVLVPELEKKAEELGRSVNALFKQSLEYEIPIEKIQGVPQYFDSVLKEHKETAYLALVDAAGRLLYTSSHFPAAEGLEGYLARQPEPEPGLQPVGPFYDLALPLIHAGKRVAVLHLGLRGELLIGQIKEIGYDILTVLLISFLLAFELLLLTFSYLINGPLDSLLARFDSLSGGHFAAQVRVKSEVEFGKVQSLLNQVIESVAERFYHMKTRCDRLQDTHPAVADLAAEIQEIEREFRIGRPGEIPQVQTQRSIDVRGLWFLFIVSAMIPGSFLPMYVAELYVPIPGVAKSLVLSSPLSIYYFFTFVGIAFAGVWSERVGRRTAMVAGALLNFLGYAGAGFAINIFDLTLYYSVAALGFGFVMIATQGHIVDNTPTDRRASALALFWAGFFAGTLCGNGIGGILAERVGYRITFELAAGISLLSALLIWRMVLCNRQHQTVHKPSLRWRDLRALLGNSRFLAVVFGLSIPAKVLMTGFVFYFVPLYLFSFEITQSNIGRVLMVYSLMFIFVGPYVARFFEGRVNHLLFVLIGTTLAGVGVVLGAWVAGVAGVLVAVTLYSLFRSSCTSTTTALALRVCESEARQLGSATVIAVAVLFERIGNIAGPLFSGLLIGTYGYQEAMYGYGLLTILGALLVLVTFAAHAMLRKGRPIPAAELP